MNNMKRTWKNLQETANDWMDWRQLVEGLCFVRGKKDRNKTLQLTKKITYTGILKKASK